MIEIPNSDRHKIVKNSSFYLSSSLLGQGIGFLRSILMPILFNPAQLGVWNFMNLILSYSPHAQLGLIHGLNKGIPLNKGNGNLKEEANIRNSVYWLNIFLSIIAFLIVFIFSFFSKEVYKTPLKILSFIIFIQMLYYYYFSLLRANSSFRIVSNGILLTSISSTFLVVIFAYLFPNPIIGGLIGLGLSTLFVLLYWQAKSTFFFPLEINWQSIRKCFYMGIPILSIGILDSITVSIDRMFIAMYMNETELGYYALGIMISGILSIIPGSIASVLYTTMLERFSVRQDPKDVKSLLIGPIRAIWALMLIITSIIIILLPLLIHFFVPKYSEAITVVQMLIFGSFFMSSSHLPGQFLIAVNKQRLIIILQISICIIVLLIDILIINLGFGLKGVALATIIGYLAYGLGYTYIALSLVIENRKNLFKYLFWQTFPFILMILSYLFLNNVLPYQGSIINFIQLAFIKLFILLCIVLISIILVNRDGLILNFIKIEIFSKFSFKNRI